MVLLGFTVHKIHVLDALFYYSVIILPSHHQTRRNGSFAGSWAPWMREKGNQRKYMPYISCTSCITNMNKLNVGHWTLYLIYFHLFYFINLLFIFWLLVQIHFCISYAGLFISHLLYLFFWPSLCVSILWIYVYLLKLGGVYYILLFFSISSAILPYHCAMSSLSIYHSSSFCLACVCVWPVLSNLSKSVIFFFASPFSISCFLFL